MSRPLLAGILIFIAFASSQTALAQHNYRDILSIPGKVDQIHYDNLLHIYAVKGTELLKYDPKGKFLFRYSDKELGSIGNVDVSFSLRPLLHYPGINYIVLLDNTLSNNRGKINLMNQGIQFGTLACTSVQNHFWFYDAMSFQLIRSNENFRPVFESGNLAQILRLQSLEPNFMIEYNNRLYVNNPASGILVFDIFGTYIKTVPIIGLEQFQVTDRAIVYFADGKLSLHNLQNYQLTEVDLPEGCLDARLQKKKILLRMPDSIRLIELL